MPAASLYSSGPLIDGLLGLAVRGSIYDPQASDLAFDDDSNVSKRGASPVEGRNYTAGVRLNLTPPTDHDLSLDLDRSVQRYENDDCQLGNLDGRSGGSAVTGCSAAAPTRANGYRDELRFEREQLALSHQGHLGFGTATSSLTHSTTETLGRTIPGNPIGDSYELNILLTLLGYIPGIVHAVWVIARR